MQVTLMQPSQPIADVSISGTNITVAGISIDCAARQRDVATMIEVRNNAGTPGEGGDGAYLAQIEIPARRYETITIPDEPGENGETGQSSEVREPVPLDPDAVVVTLWPII